jgi:gliding motility-associated protein GldL
MNLSEIVQSAGWKNLMAKMYGWGASVVIIGALFKIQHWPFAGVMLTIGLGVEAVIFFFSAFEPLHEELDWTLVYPELAGMHEDTDEFAIAPKRQRGEVVSGSGAALAKFDQMIESAEITPDLFRKLGEGLKTLNVTTSRLTDISDASLATNEYVANVKNAAISVNSLTDTYNKSNEKLQESVGVLSQSYHKTADVVTGSGEKLGNSYESLATSLNQDGQVISQRNQHLSEKLEGMNKNLTALNAVYELELQYTNDHLKGAQELYSDFHKITSNLSSSVQETEKYREEISKLSKNLAELNSIYGNMLSAMSLVRK